MDQGKPARGRVVSPEVTLHVIVMYRVYRRDVIGIFTSVSQVIGPLAAQADVYRSSFSFIIDPHCSPALLERGPSRAARCALSNWYFAAIVRTRACIVCLRTVGLQQSA